MSNAIKKAIRNEEETEIYEIGYRAGVTSAKIKYGELDVVVDEYVPCRNNHKFDLRLLDEHLKVMYAKGYNAGYARIRVKNSRLNAKKKK